MILILQLTDILVFLLLVWVFVYTVSYGVWTFRRNNKVGAVAVFLVALIAFLLPVLTLYYTK
ncbi:MAG: hypothetical protein GX754_07435 [Clostridiaceae bacterium]|nr:hypothetical protein [Clostridiaceae bacterium]